MPTAILKLDSNREWVMIPSSIPSTAMSSRDGMFAFVKEGSRVVVGDVCVECLRNNKGTLVSVVLPNGYAFPTGRTSPRQNWFLMLKNYLRQWLALSPEGRVIRIANEGIEALSERLGRVAVPLDDYVGEADDETLRQGISRLEEYRATALGQLPRGANEQEILKSYYDWIVTTAIALGISQRDLTNIIDRGVRSNQRVEVEDLDSAALFGAVEFTRFLDL